MILALAAAAHACVQIVQAEEHLPRAAGERRSLGGVDHHLGLRFASPDGREQRMQAGSSGGNRICLRTATTIAAAASVRTVDRGSVRPLFISSTLSRLSHFTTVFQSMPRFRFPAHATLAFAVLLPRRHAWSWRCQDEPVQGCSSHTRIWITPSNRGSKGQASPHTLTNP